MADLLVLQPLTDLQVGGLFVDVAHDHALALQLGKPPIHQLSSIVIERVEKGFSSMILKPINIRRVSYYRQFSTIVKINKKMYTS